MFTGDGEPQNATTYIARLSSLLDAGRLRDPDRYSIGGSVAALEEAAASSLGKEAAVWMPTGTMANLLALGALCSSAGDGAARVLLPHESHVYNDTGDGVSRVLSLQPVPLAQVNPPSWQRWCSI